MALLLCVVGMPVQAGGALITYVAMGLSAIGVNAVVASIGGYLALAAVVGGGLSSLRTKMPSQPQVRQELEQPTERPYLRYVYGRTRASGTPLRAYRRNDRRVYGCLILNSRPSEGGDVEIMVDGRRCTYPAEWGQDDSTLPVTYDKFSQGDVFDFDGDGLGVQPDVFPGWNGSGDGEDFLRVWIGRGDQTQPPQRILDETDGYFTESDAGTGLTVLWYRMDRGKDQTKLFKRWPNWPRWTTFDVIMDWSRVYDPREVSHDADDPSTWEYSDNQALCLLDSIRRNPIQPWPDAQIILSTFTDAADVADEAVPLLNGGSEARYRAAGVLQWSRAELYSQIAPVERAGGGQLFYSGGKLGYKPGSFGASQYTLSDVLDDAPLQYVSLPSARSIPRELSANYTRPQRDYETAELPAMVVHSGEGSADSLDLGMVFSASQARRLQSMAAARYAAQTSISCTAPPSAFECLPGTTVTVDLDGLEHMDGTYAVQSCNPGLWLQDLAGSAEGDAGVALRVPLTLQAEAASFYAWTAATDELEIVDPLEQLEDVALTLGVGAAEVDAAGDVPNDATYTQVRLYRAATDAGFATAQPTGAAQTVTAGSSFSLTFTGVATGAADFYLVPWSAESLGPPDGPHPLTVT